MTPIPSFWEYPILPHGVLLFVCCFFPNGGDSTRVCFKHQRPEAGCSNLPPPDGASSLCTLSPVTLYPYFAVCRQSYRCTQISLFTGGRSVTAWERVLPSLGVSPRVGAGRKACVRARLQSPVRAGSTGFCSVNLLHLQRSSQILVFLILKLLFMDHLLIDSKAWKVLS